MTMIFSALGEWLLTFVRGWYYRRLYERSIRLNHELKRQVIDLTLERDHFKQRLIFLTEVKK